MTKISKQDNALLGLGKSRRVTILCFVAYYLPGYRSGGPVRTIANFVDHLGDDFDIRIVTRDRDALDSEPYSNIQVDAWNTVGNAKVFYASKEFLTISGVSHLLEDTPYDLLYVNSFFSFKFTILPLLGRKLSKRNTKPGVIAPRGEFSKGAITLKAWKKRPYLMLAKLTGLYRGLKWQASSEFEVLDIAREFGVGLSDIYVAPDLAPRLSSSQLQTSLRTAGPIRIVFLSRISPKKNLDYLLRILSKVSSKIHLTIIGPLSENSYWKECQALIDELPQHVIAEYEGEVVPEEIPETFRKYDLFVFPTKGENYGHVILESLTAGTPVLTSDQTPWLSSGNGAIQTLTLDDESLWIKAIEFWASLGGEQLESRREEAKEYARSYLASSEAVNQNREFFLRVSNLNNFQ